jgi:type III pantothenate kinase
MAHARPVVATAVGGLVDAVDDGVTGLLVDQWNVAALRAAVERLLQDGPLRERLGDGAYMRANRLFSFALAAEATIQVYRRAISS